MAWSVHHGKTARIMALVAGSLYVCLVLPAVSVLARLSVVWRAVERKSIERDNQKLLSRAGRRGRVVRLNGKVNCSGVGHLYLGENVHINGNAFLRAEAGLTIDDNAHISRNVTIYTVNHDYTGDALPYGTHLIGKPVQIDRNVWIGMNVCILPGVHIHEGAIIGMGAVVTKDVRKMRYCRRKPSQDTQVPR